MKFLCFLGAFLFCLTSSAIQTSVFPVVLKQRFLENQNNEFFFQRVETFGANLTFDFYQLGIEIGDWTMESGTGLISFQETYKEIQSTHLFKMVSFNDWLRLYSGLGLGAYESELTNQFNGTYTKTSSDRILNIAGIVSIQSIFAHFHGGLDLRLLVAKDFRPQPTPEIVVKLGAVF